MVVNYKEYSDSELLNLIKEESEEAKDILYEKYKYIIGLIIKKYTMSAKMLNIEYNDLYQEGMLGLSQAINNYSSHRNIKFSTFAFTCIERKIISAIKKANRKKHSILNESFSLDYTVEDNRESFENIIASPNENIEEMLVLKEKKDYFVKKINDVLTPFEKKVYELKLNNYSYEQIADNLGKSYKSVESALFRVRIKLKKILKEMV